MFVVNIHTFIGYVHFATDLEMESPLACHLCSRIYKLQCVLNRHLREVHKVMVLPGGNLKCPLCESFRVNRQASLRVHLEETHGIRCERRNIKFPNYAVFQRWKSSEEKETLYSYTKKTSTKVVAGSGERFYFHCHRSGHYQTKSTGERRLKKQGSNRIESTCPSMMVVTKDATGQTRVNYWKTHVGHQADLLHTVVPRRERARIIGRSVFSPHADSEEEEEEEDERTFLVDEPREEGMEEDLVIVRRVEEDEGEDDEGEGEDFRIRARREVPPDIRLTVFKVTDCGPTYEAFQGAAVALLAAASKEASVEARREALRLVEEATAILGDSHEEAIGATTDCADDDSR